MAFFVEKEKRPDRNYTTTMPLHPFLFMGCWNKNSDGHHAVMNAILKSPEPILILGGDNAYSDKKTNIMNYQFVFGEFDKLQAKEKFVALGNHNLDNPTTLNREYAMHTNVQQRWNMPDNYYSYTFADNYAIIVLDTSPFHFWPDKSYSGINLDFVADMMTWLLKTVKAFQSTNTRYYLVQHDPIVSHKRDNVRYLQEGTQILDTIASYPPVAILCADTHNFQEGLLEFKGKFIKQYVAATGGGDPYDIYSTVFNSPNKGSERPRYLLERFTSGYGFLRISDDWKNPVEFHKVMEWPDYVPNSTPRRVVHSLHPMRNVMKSQTKTRKKTRL